MIDWITFLIATPAVETDAEGHKYSVVVSAFVELIPSSPGPEAFCGQREGLL